MGKNDNLIEDSCNDARLNSYSDSRESDCDDKLVPYLRRPALIGTPFRPHRVRQRSIPWPDPVGPPSPLLLPGRQVEDSSDTPGCMPR
jgi:hypothetical protein